MALLHWLSYLGGLAAFLFVTLSLASGLLWLAELIEEHSRYSKVVGMRAIYAIVALHILLVFTDDLPIVPTLLGVVSHLTYLTNFSTTWPFISLTSPRFLASCALVVADHFAWFFHFAAKANEAKRYRQPKYRYGGVTVTASGPAFMDVAAFFAIFVWAVPLFLFLSLSANDNALPSFGPSSSAQSSPVEGGQINLDTPGGGAQTHKQQRTRTSTSLVKSTLSPLLELLPRLRRGKKRDDEGLLAPRTPVRGSPLHSPVQMPPTYFPWADNDNSARSRSPVVASVSGSDSLRARAGTPPLGAGRPNSSRLPPAPRRIQSEAIVSKGINPRGIASRNGVPFSPEDRTSGTTTSTSTRSSSDEVGSRSSASALGYASDVRMSLGPQGSNEKLGNAEVVVADDLTKRKAD